MEKKQMNYAKLSMILGLVGLLGSCLCIGAPIAIVALVLGIISLKNGCEESDKKMALGGTITGIIGVLIMFVYIAIMASAEPADNSGQIVSTENVSMETNTTETIEQLTETSENSAASSEEIKATEALDNQSYEAALTNIEETETVSELTIHFIDVGQGDATLIECDDEYLLIDAGNNDKGTLVQNYLMKQGVETLDYVVGTHPDADHIGGLDVAIYKFDCETIILPETEKDTKTYEDVISVIDEKGYKVTAPVVGDTYSLGSAEFMIIAPNDNYTSNANDNSVGILLQNGDNRFLFVGDAEEDAEEDIINSGIHIFADVYKVSHHGSKTATTDAFLAAVSPSYAVISVGEENAYGHPSAEVLNKLREAGIEVFRTDEQGTIIATSDGKNITWNCSPSETWQAGEAKGSAGEENSVDAGKSQSSNSNSTNTADTSGSGANTGAGAGNTATEGTGTGAGNTAAESTGADAVISESTGTDTGAAITETPAETTTIIVHITDTGKKYHSAGCRYLHSSDIEIELSQAKARGLTPCSVCNPPQ